MKATCSCGAPLDTLAPRCRACYRAYWARYMANPEARAKNQARDREYRARKKQKLMAQIASAGKSPADARAHQ